MITFCCFTETYYKMRRVCSLLICCTFLVAAHAQSENNDIDEIKVVCNYYIDGGTNGDSLLFSKAFYPEGQMLFIRNDTLQIVSFKDFTARMKNSGKKQERKTSIESVEVYGNAAVAFITIEYPGFFLHDIMSLLKTDKGWKIVGKIFSREERK